MLDLVKQSLHYVCTLPAEYTCTPIQLTDSVSIPEFIDTAQNTLRSPSKLGGSLQLWHYNCWTSTPGTPKRIFQSSQGKGQACSHPGICKPVNWNAALCSQYCGATVVLRPTQHAKLSAPAPMLSPTIVRSFVNSWGLLSNGSFVTIVWIISSNLVFKKYGLCGLIFIKNISYVINHFDTSIQMICGRSS